MILVVINLWVIDENWSQTLFWFGSGFPKALKTDLTFKRNVLTKSFSRKEGYSCFTQQICCLFLVWSLSQRWRSRTILPAIKFGYWTPWFKWVLQKCMLHFKLFCILLSTCGSLGNSFTFIFCIMYAEHCTHVPNKFPKAHNLPWFFPAVTDFLPQLKSESLHFVMDDVLSFLKLNYQIGQTVFCCIPKHWDRSWKYDIQWSIFDEFWGTGT